MFYNGPYDRIVSPGLGVSPSIMVFEDGRYRNDSDTGKTNLTWDYGEDDTEQENSSLQRNISHHFSHNSESGVLAMSRRLRALISKKPNDYE
jgi:hypothetical protein